MFHWMTRNAVNRVSVVEPGLSVETQEWRPSGSGLRRSFRSPYSRVTRGSVRDGRRNRQLAEPSALATAGRPRPAPPAMGVRRTADRQMIRSDGL